MFAQQPLYWNVLVEEVQSQDLLQNAQRMHVRIGERSWV